jgi:broad specificity phosphatase PhoE
MTRIILIRHGQTLWNQLERVRGQVDIPLDKVGLAQAEATARRVAEEWKPAVVYSSPLQRAVQTAQCIATMLGVEVRKDPDLNDINFGQWQGLSPQEVLERWPELASTWLRAPHLVAFPDGESLDAVKVRSTAALQRAMERHLEETVAIVGHTALNRVLLCAVVGIDNSNYWRIEQHTCAINVFEWRDGIFYIEALNDTCHLKSLPSSQGKASQ